MIYNVFQLEYFIQKLPSNSKMSEWMMQKCALCRVLSFNWLFLCFTFLATALQNRHGGSGMQSSHRSLILLAKICPQIYFHKHYIEQKRVDVKERIVYDLIYMMFKKM